MFYRIQLGWVWRKENQDTPMLLSKAIQLLFTVEWGIVHHNHSSFWNCWEQTVFEPILKQFMVHCPMISAWSYDLVSHQRSYYACTRIPAAPDNAMNQLSSGRITILPVQIPVYSDFIYISNIFRRNISYFIFVCCNLVVILLLAACSLFFRVIFKRFKAFCTAESAQPNSIAISFWYASGYWATYAWSLAGSIFLKERFGTLGVRLPVSWICFSHFRMVEIATLNTLLVSSSVCPSWRYSMTRSLYFTG